MLKKHYIDNNSIIFAPLEGVTDSIYRQTILENYPEWDYVFTEFFRVGPQSSASTKKHLIKHIGEKIYNNKTFLDKTCFQLLASDTSEVATASNNLSELGINWVDLNIGCPAKKVNSHRGGAYLMSDHLALSKIVKAIRKNFKMNFSAKIRLGINDDSPFIDTIKMLESEGVDMITIHPRTKKQMYSGKADWSYINKACKSLSIPVIGNGDIWSISDVSKIYEQTNCHSIMLGRPALQTPWFSQSIKNKVSLDISEKKIYIMNYFLSLEKNYASAGMSSDTINKRLKAFSHYIFNNFDPPMSTNIKLLLLRSKTLIEFKAILTNYLI